MGIIGNTNFIPAAPAVAPAQNLVANLAVLFHTAAIMPNNAALPAFLPHPNNGGYGAYLDDYEQLDY